MIHTNNKLSWQTRMESMLLALVSIFESILRLITFCYISFDWTLNIQVWSLKRGLKRMKEAKK